MQITFDPMNPEETARVMRYCDLEPYIRDELSQLRQAATPPRPVNAPAVVIPLVAKPNGAEGATSEDISSEISPESTEISIIAEEDAKADAYYAVSEAEAVAEIEAEEAAEEVAPPPPPRPAPPSVRRGSKAAAPASPPGWPPGFPAPRGKPPIQDPNNPKWIEREELRAQAWVDHAAREANPPPVVPRRKPGPAPQEPAMPRGVTVKAPPPPIDGEMDLDTFKGLYAEYYKANSSKTFQLLRRPTWADGSARPAPQPWVSPAMVPAECRVQLADEIGLALAAP